MLAKGLLQTGVELVAESGFAVLALTRKVQTELS